ncbi:ABC transporter substrate-binding protein [Acidipropionibacterium virtanenii]|uniref:Thiamine biosynthesis protein n=1 Tax=Acidipropionibacterium virtanenii TaxID=2057246 RepID=A0A344UTZ2_9ACTN|nr:ABC transporter substrate-binding protein [Acidipropionibacterium virtanenii]AXE38740.1 Putative thiamine biosynthesis protein [Acidipropionibacterium virtanenii]
MTRSPQHTAISRRRLGLAAVGAALALAGCGRKADARTSTRSRAVNLLLDWNPNPDHVTIYTAQHTGAFSKAGVDVAIHNPANTADAAKQVSLGRADLAVSYEPDTLIAVAQGLRVVSVAALIPTCLTSLIARKDSGITSAADLAGKTVALSGLASQKPSVEYIARKAHVDPATITMPNVQQSLDQALLTGKAHAVYGAFRNIEGIELAGKIPVTVLPATELGLPGYSELVIIANPERLTSDAGYAGRVKAFLKGLAAGQAIALAHPDEAVTAMQVPAKGSYDRATLARMVKATVSLLGAEFGVQKGSDWASYATWMHRNGLLDTAVDGAKATTNEWLVK